MSKGTFINLLATLALSLHIYSGCVSAASPCGNDNLYCFGEDLTSLPFDSVFASGIDSDCKAFKEDKRPPSAWLHDSGLTVALRYHTIGDLSLFRLGNFDISAVSNIREAAVSSWGDLGEISFYGPEDMASIKSTTEAQRILNFGPAIASNASFVIFSAVDGYVGFDSKPRSSLVYYDHRTQKAFYKHNSALIKDTIQPPARVVLSVPHPDQEDDVYIVVNLGAALRLYRYAISDEAWTVLVDFPTGTRINGGTFIPMGSDGIIVFFTTATMQKVLIYDIESGTLLEQETNEGEVPEYREGPCVSTVSAQDGSSHQIHVTFGASSMDGSRATSFSRENHYILTLPKLQWIKAPIINRTGSHAVCGILNGRNLLVYNGFRPQQEISDSCTEQLYLLDLSELTSTQNTKTDNYLVPELVRKVVGGIDKGCGNVSIPKDTLSSALYEALEKPYTHRQFSQLTEKECIPSNPRDNKNSQDNSNNSQDNSNNSQENNKKSGMPLGVIAGIVAGAVALIAVAGLCYCRFRVFRNAGNGDKRKSISTAVRKRHRLQAWLWAQPAVPIANPNSVLGDEMREIDHSQADLVSEPSIPTHTESPYNEQGNVHHQTAQYRENGLDFADIAHLRNQHATAEAEFDEPAFTQAEIPVPPPPPPSRYLESLASSSRASRLW